jgi:hypothetical protein
MLGIVGAIVVALLLFAVIGSKYSTLYLLLGSLSMAGRIFVGAFLVQVLPYGWDIEQFHEAALVILSGSTPDSSLTVSSFASIQAVLYAVFEADPAVVAVFNAFCTTVVALLIIDVTQKLYPGLISTDGLLATILFLPLPLFFLAIPMRDAAGVFLCFLLLAALVRAFDGDRWPLVAALPLGGYLYLLRPELAVILAIGTVVGATARGIEYLRPATTLRELFPVAVIGGLVLLPVVGPRVPFTMVRGQLNARTTGGGAYLEHVEYGSWIDLIVAAPVRAVYFQFAPFPLHVNSAFDFAAALMTPIVVILAVAAYRCVRSCQTDTPVLVTLLVVYGLGIAGYGLIDSNFGTTVRHRIPFTFLLCILAAPTLERWWNLLRRTIVGDGAPLTEWVRSRPDE